jgi:hypothetical protein
MPSNGFLLALLLYFRGISHVPSTKILTGQTRGIDRRIRHAGSMRRHDASPWRVVRGSIEGKWEEAEPLRFPPWRRN